MSRITSLYFFPYLKMKKGEIAIQWIVVAVLALLFLVVLAIVYQDQLSKLLGGISDIIDNVIGTSDAIDFENAANN
tara:strand:+ start:823 stop:1050 length:228 start_codon:yes stop_codon:yes gene_type:complete